MPTTVELQKIMSFPDQRIDHLHTASKILMEEGRVNYAKSLMYLWCTISGKKSKVNSSER